MGWWDFARMHSSPPHPGLPVLHVRHTRAVSSRTAGQPVSQCWLLFCSLPVSSKLILLAEPSGETSFSGRT